jgi:hypothetical protein
MPKRFWPAAVRIFTRFAGPISLALSEAHATAPRGRPFASGSPRIARTGSSGSRSASRAAPKIAILKGRDRSGHAPAFHRPIASSRAPASHLEAQGATVPPTRTSPARTRDAFGGDLVSKHDQHASWLSSEGCRDRIVDIVERVSGPYQRGEPDLTRLDSL